MAQVGVYRDAKLFIGGADLSADLYELAVSYAAEMLDATTFGQTTRVVQGGLFMGEIAGAGYFRGGDGAVEQVIFSQIGVDDVVIAVFPDGITEGATSTGMGYAMKGELSEFKLGGSVGILLPITFAAQSRGL